MGKLQLQKCKYSLITVFACICIITTNIFGKMMTGKQLFLIFIDCCIKPMRWVDVIQIWRIKWKRIEKRLRPFPERKIDNDRLAKKGQRVITVNKNARAIEIKKRLNFLIQKLTKAQNKKFNGKQHNI